MSQLLQSIFTPARRRAEEETFQKFTTAMVMVGEGTEKKKGMLANLGFSKTVRKKVGFQLTLIRVLLPINVILCSVLFCCMIWPNHLLLSEPPLKYKKLSDLT